MAKIERTIIQTVSMNALVSYTLTFFDSVDIRYDVGGYHTCLSRRIPGFESQ